MADDPQYDDDMPESEKAELRELDEEARRAPADTDVEVNLFGAAAERIGGKVEPVKLTAEDTFCFSCHKDVSCWNKCCHGADITLTPYDILRLARSRSQAPRDFLAEFTVPAIHEQSGLPVAKLRMGGADGSGPCPFMADEGCTVYANRPVTCRYYPLGWLSAKLKDSPDRTDFHFIVREEHCQGHKESHEQSVGVYRGQQGVETYDRANRGWIDILMKMSSWRGLGGPQGQDVSQQTKQMFFMVSTDADTFRRFVLESRFLETYLVDEEVLDVIKVDDVALLNLGFDWMKNVMFNEPTISLREEVLRQAIAKVREDYTGG